MFVMSLLLTKYFQTKFVLNQFTNCNHMMDKYIVIFQTIKHEQRILARVN